MVKMQTAQLFVPLKRIAAIAIAGLLSSVLMLQPVFGQVKEDWKEVLATAKKEGKVVIYGVSTTRPVVEAVRPEFKKRFGIEIEYLMARSREVRERINTERRARKPIGDVAHAGATSLPALWEDGGLEQWLPPSIAAIRPEIVEAMDIPQMPITPIYVNLRGILINTKLVPSGEEPKSWLDVTNPKWKGKILIDDPRSAGAGNSLFVSTIRHPALGKEFHQKLAENKPTVLGAGNYDQIAVKVAQGEYAIGFPADADVITELKGAPVKWIAPTEGVTYTIQGIGLVKNAARPNAGKVFIEFTLSEEFQKALARTTAPVRKGIASMRKEWSLEHTKLLPRPIAESREEREQYYRLVESIYGIR
jgi:iron(III) transport system substrate-binding protein